MLEYRVTVWTKGFVSEVERYDFATYDEAEDYYNDIVDLDKYKDFDISADNIVTDEMIARTCD